MGEARALREAKLRAGRTTGHGWPGWGQRKIQHPRQGWRAHSQEKLSQVSAWQYSKQSLASCWLNDPPGMVGPGPKKNSTAAPWMACKPPRDAVTSFSMAPSQTKSTSCWPNDRPGAALAHPAPAALMRPCMS